MGFTIGQLARKVLGGKFWRVARFYRSIFVNLERVADVVCEELDDNASLLDVGGGDGELINLILDRRPNTHVTMLDLKTEIGGSIHTKYWRNITLLPNTQLATIEGQYDLVLLSDVVHHLPLRLRELFFRQALMVLRNNARKLVIKDVEPIGMVSYLSYLSDFYISGDKDVSLISCSELIDSIRAIDHRIVVHETRLILEDHPNYCLVFRIDS